MEWKAGVPASYQTALYIRLSKENKKNGPFQSVQSQEFLLREFARQHWLASTVSIWTMSGAVPTLTALAFIG